MFELQDRDKEHLIKKGITEKKFYDQLKLLKQGVPFIDLVRPCTMENGVKSLGEIELEQCIDLYENSLGRVNPVKFVPASGAASRMFAVLSKLLNNYEQYEDKISGDSKDNDTNSLLQFTDNINSFAFAEDLKDVIKNNGGDLQGLIDDKNYKVILEQLLTDKGLDYLNCPKGLIKFHKYEDQVRTAFEEHLFETKSYSKNSGGTAWVHFTILKEHEHKFNEYARSVISKYEGDGVKLNVSFSFQSPDTDIVAVDFDDNPLRNKDGELVFRPGGHGALLQNLGDLDAEIIFVKNIDNVVPDRLKDKTIIYKKALAGYLLDLKKNIDDYLNLISENKINDSQLEDARGFINDRLEIEIPADFEATSAEQKKEYIFNVLNRPLRVCGVVKNEGEPGGGPFWVKDLSGNISKQIVESAQVDINNKEQSRIWNSSTHFNPVDLVCSIYDCKGNKFDLDKFVDMNTVFITKKSKDGTDLKAMELPGLWNGSMAYWNTIFVEVPLITFNPVKTVFDLLKPEHQAG